MDFYAEEGSIQGLVYAVDAMLHGGLLAPKEYARYIHEELVPNDFDTLSQTSPVAVEKVKREVAARTANS